MIYEISSDEYERLFSNDIAELFEIFAENHYLAVVNTAVSESETAIIASLVTLSHEFCNMSEVMHVDTEKRKYAFQIAIERNEAQEMFLRYETLEDAKKHAIELLSTVTLTF